MLSTRAAVRTATTARAAASTLGNSAAASRRWLNVHECDAYTILNKNGVATPKGLVATTPEEAKARADELGGNVIVKAQVLAGGRGMGTFKNGFKGGVHVAKSSAEAADLAGKMLGQRLVTKQTGEDGRPVNKVMIGETIEIVKEMYLAFVLDRASNGVAVVGSEEGGMSIEDTAKNNPDAIIRQSVGPNGLTDEQATKVSQKLGIPENLIGQSNQMLHNLFQTVMATDATQIEVNPLAVTADGRVLAADAKLNFDDNAEFRQKEIFALRDESQEDARDVEASKFDLSYVGLDGKVGCLVNGAGLAMSTMDILNQFGGEPANFLDVGGSATKETISAAFKIITADPHVNTIFVNIFGGIMSCETIATGIMAALEEVEVKVPLVVRLQGTHSDRGSALLASYKGNTDLIAIPDLDNAAKTASIISKLHS